MGTVYDTSAVQNTYIITIDANNPTQYTISPPATPAQTYTLDASGKTTIFLPPGSVEPPATAPDTDASYSVVLSGKPVAGDQFVAQFNSAGVGDNRNGLALNAIKDNKVFNGQTESVLIVMLI